MVKNLRDCVLFLKDYKENSFFFYIMVDDIFRKVLLLKLKYVLENIK